MRSDENQRKVFDFFMEHLESKAPFTKADVEAVTTWQGQTFGTYWSKQLSPFVIDLSNGSFRVSEAFRRYATWDRFQQHVTQVRRVASSDYNHSTYDRVIVYEFFMPLTNEAYLRVALDSLFYRDTVEARLRTVDPAELDKAFPPLAGESAETTLERRCAWISSHFGGYSIYHVNGRFRAQPLAMRAAVSVGTRYLVDETTAVTRFIFPCEDAAEAEQVEFFFTHLFVKAIIEVVNGEDEIWMVETGFRNQLHIWRVAT